MSNSFVLLVSLFLASCAVPRQSNIVHLQGWGTIEFRDSAQLQGKEMWGIYDGGEGNRFIISRRSPDIEKTIVHEYLHSIGLNHRTPEETEEFLKAMKKFGYDSM